MQKINFTNRLLTYWNHLIGTSDSLSQESKVFHSFSIITFLICLVMLILNLAIGLIGSFYIALIILLCHSGVFYLSRFKGKLNLALLLTGVECNIFLTLNYFVDAGINGPTLVLFVSSLLLMISLGKDKDLVVWVLFNLGTVIIILIIEYYHPQTVLFRYNNKIDQYTDISVTYILIVLLISVCIYYLRKNSKKQEEELRNRAEALVKLNKEKDKLFSIISHDFKAPLAAVQQYLSLLADEDLTLEERIKLEKDLIKITSNTQDLLVNLLSWCSKQLESGRVNLKKYNLKNIIDSTIENAKTQCIQKNIALNYTIDEKIEVVADKDMLQLVFRNLLNNAVKFTHKKGQIWINTKINNQTCVLSIKDNGIGIPEEKKAHIFSLNANSTYGTANEKGTGLGLMLSKEYMVLQQGKIWFDSDGDGTIFYISIPLKKS